MEILINFLVLPLLAIAVLSELLKWLVLNGLKLLIHFFKHDAPK